MSDGECGGLYAAQAYCHPIHREVLGHLLGYLLVAVGDVGPPHLHILLLVVYRLDLTFVAPMLHKMLAGPKLCILLVTQLPT